LLAVLIAGTDNSPGYRELVRDRGSIIDLASTSYIENSGAIFILEAWIDPKNEIQGITDLANLLYTFKDRKIDKNMLERAKRQILHSKIYQQETVQGQAGRLGLYEAMAGDYHYDSRQYELLKSITEKDIQDYAAQFFTPKTSSINLISSEKKYAISSSKSVTENTIREIVDKTYRKHKSGVRGKNFKIREEPIEKIVFPQGITLIMKRDTSMPLVFGVAVMPGGARIETEEKSGI
jgi:zinc protease